MESNVCVWKESTRKGKDWYLVSCLKDSPVDPVKVAMRRGLSLVDIFKKCPFCGKPVATLLKNGKQFVPISNS